VGADPVEHVLRSKTLGNERALHLHRRAGATQALILLDAEYFVQMPSLECLFDGTAQGGRVPSTHLVLVSSVDPRTRWLESFCNPSFATFLVDELLPWVRDATGLGSEAPLYLGGLSLTGLAALHAGSMHPTAYRGILALSPSVWWEDERLLDDCRTSPGELPATSMIVGSEETAAPVDHGDGLIQRESQVGACRRFRDLLRDRETPQSYREYAGGHALVDWERELRGAFERLVELA